MADTDSVDYRIEPSGGTTYTIVRTADGKVVEQVDDNADLCTFMRWARGRCDVPKQFQLPIDSDDSEFFCTATLDGVIEWFKQSGNVLFCEELPSDQRSASGRHFKLGKVGQKVPVGDAHFVPLAKAVQLRPEFAAVRADGLSGQSVPIWVSKTLHRHMDDELQRDDSDVRKISSCPVQRAFAYLDISDFSQFPAGQQALVINTLTALATRDDNWTEEHEADIKRKLESALCIGDGFIYCFEHSGDATYFAARLAQKIETSLASGTLPVNFHFRIGVHVGPVYRFWDWGRKDWNYIGEGINGGARVLEAIGKDADDIMFISAAVREELIGPRWEEVVDPHFQLRLRLQNRGRRADKHKGMWRVYELNHMAIFP